MDTSFVEKKKKAQEIQKPKIVFYKTKKKKNKQTNRGEKKEKPITH